MEIREAEKTEGISQKNESNSFIAKTYAWMSLALILSAASAFFVYASPYASTLIWGTFNGLPIGFTILAILEIALVLIFSLKIRTMKVSTAAFCLILYSVINGLTLSSIFFAYELYSIIFTFLASALMFGFMALYGALTKTNLASAGKYLMMGLIGVILISFANAIVTLITKQPMEKLDWILSIALVVIFAGLTAYDTQKIVKTSANANGSDAYKKIAIYGALELYLDFINIFLRLLRLFGRRK